MQIDTSAANQAELRLAQGETVHFALTYLRGRSFGVSMLPPCPLGSPLARLLHGCYWLGRCHAAQAPTTLHLTGPGVVGRFQVVDIPAGRSLFINCAHLVGFAFAAGGRLHTKLGEVLSPTMWALGHPLPVVADGPGQVILYGEGLHQVEVAAGAEFIPAQVAAFDAGTAFAARALDPDAGILSQVANAIGRQARIVFVEAASVVIQPINRPNRKVSRMALHLAIHLAVLLLLLALFGS